MEQRNKKFEGLDTHSNQFNVCFGLFVEFVDIRVTF